MSQINNAAGDFHKVLFLPSPSDTKWWQWQCDRPKGLCFTCFACNWQVTKVPAPFFRNLTIVEMWSDFVVQATGTSHICTCLWGSCACGTPNLSWQSFWRSSGVSWKCEDSSTESCSASCHITQITFKFQLVAMCETLDSKIRRLSLKRGTEGLLIMARDHNSNQDGIAKSKL